MEFDGLYLDGPASPLPCLNTNHGCGYLGKDGQVPHDADLAQPRAGQEPAPAVRGERQAGHPGRAHSGTVRFRSSPLRTPISTESTWATTSRWARPVSGRTCCDPDVRTSFGMPCAQLPVRGTAPEVERGRTLSLLYDSLVTWSQYTRKTSGAHGRLSAWMSALRAVVELREIGNLRHRGLRISAYVQDGRGCSW